MSDWYAFSASLPYLPQLLANWEHDGGNWASRLTALCRSHFPTAVAYWSWRTVLVMDAVVVRCVSVILWLYGHAVVTRWCLRPSFHSVYFSTITHSDVRMVSVYAFYVGGVVLGTKKYIRLLWSIFEACTGVIHKELVTYLLNFNE